MKKRSHERESTMPAKAIGVSVSLALDKTMNPREPKSMNHYKNVKKLVSVLAVVSMITMISGPALAKSKSSPRQQVLNTGDPVVLRWNETAIAAMPPAGGPPFPPIRFMAIV